MFLPCFWFLVVLLMLLICGLTSEVGWTHCTPVCDSFAWHPHKKLHHGLCTQGNNQIHHLHVPFLQFVIDKSLIWMVIHCKRNHLKRVVNWTPKDVTLSFEWCGIIYNDIEMGLSSARQLTQNWFDSRKRDLRALQLSLLKFWIDSTAHLQSMTLFGAC